MIKTFLATLNPMLMLFICIVVGFVLCKTKILPENAGKVMAKLETWVFCPALSFYTMAYYCTVDNIGTHATNIYYRGLALRLRLQYRLHSLAFSLEKTSTKETFINTRLHLRTAGTLVTPLRKRLQGI